jgi:acyl-CoA thioesterase-2
MTMTNTGSAHHRRLLDILDLHESPRGPDRYTAPTPSEGPPRLFGGQVASQAVRALTLTVAPDRPIHSLHAYFIRPGRPGVPLELAVERTRDGRSFSTRRVEAIQEGEAILVADASFHVAEPGDDWQEGGLPEGVSDDPDDVVRPERRTDFSAFRDTMPFEVRPVRPTEGFDLHPCWVRLRDPIPDDPGLHASALTYVSDLAVVGSARAPHSTANWMGSASLDHAIWFHRPARLDDWLLFDVDPVSNYGARGLARGTFHTRQGVLVASISQEALLRR